MSGIIDWSARQVYSRVDGKDNNGVAVFQYLVPFTGKFNGMLMRFAIYDNLTEKVKRINYENNTDVKLLNVTVFYNYEDEILVKVEYKMN